MNGGEICSDNSIDIKQNLLFQRDRRNVKMGNSKQYVELFEMLNKLKKIDHDLSTDHS